ncbi:hypothetical protein GCM10009128_08170 [Psychrosphaera haliotis]|uniref:pullulanase-associated domain-containing protein n=1 Tax=Psychrosphaera haliotis TaxID=555083 RepID=UPI0031D488BE
MNFKLKPLSLAALATATVLSGCGTEEETIQKTTVFDAESNTGLWCKLPDIVQTVDADFHPLTETEVAALKTVALSIADPDNTFSDTEKETFRSSFNAYEFDYGTYDLYQTLGLTKEEEARRLVAKEEARQFKIDQKQDVIFGDDFDTWFDAWFETVPYTDYLGNSQRLPKAALGLELALSASNNGEEACYTPPTDCPNYQMVDESGKYNCIIPEENPIEDAPAVAEAAQVASDSGKAVMFYRKNGEQVESNYTDITIHVWNDSNCTAYNEETSTTTWGSGLAHSGIDDNYGMYWILDLQESHDSCGNMIVYQKGGDKQVTQNDAMVPLGKSGDVVFHNLNKMSFFQEGFTPNVLDGAYLANQHPYFGAAAGGKSCGWGTSLDEAGEACLGQVIENCPEGTYAVGAGQVDIASKCVAEFDPEETTFLLRGGFNGWGNPTDGQEFQQTSPGKYHKMFEYGEHPEDATLEFASETSVEITVEAGATITFEQPVDDDGKEIDFELDLNSIPTGATLILADGTEVVFAENENKVVLPESAEVPTVENLMIDLAAGSKITFAAGANHGDFVCTEDCVTSYVFKIADADWSEPASYGGVSGGDALEVGGNPKPLTAGEGVGQDIGIKMQDTSVYQFTFDATTPSEATLKVDQIAIQALPAVKIGDTETQLDLTSNSVYKARLELTAQTYSLTITDLLVGGDLAYGAATGGETDITYSVVIDLAEGSDALSLTILENGKFDFTLDLSDSENPTLKVEQAAPYGEDPVYLRGSMNGWGANEIDEVKYDKDSRTYTTIIGLEASENHKFKIADASWGAVNKGGSDFIFSSDGEAIRGDGDMFVTTTNSTVYAFSISFAAPGKPVLKVDEAPIYIRGGIYGAGDWAADETMRLNFKPVDAESDEEGGNIFAETLTTTGPGSFKIADADWGGAFGVNYGASPAQADSGESTIVLGQPITLVDGNDSQNLNFNYPAGKYYFSFDNATKSLVITAVEE